MRPTIQIINNSTVISNGQLQPMVDAVQIQVARDFSPIWNINANLVLLPAGQRPDAQHWWVGIFDDADQASALGYHDYTNNALPLGKVFSKTVIMSGSSVSVTISHETIEMLANPYLTNCILDPSGTKIWAMEVADAPESDDYGYDITLTNGQVITVSDFQTRAWFGQCPATTTPTKYDFMGHCHEPFEVLNAGYASYANLSDGQWREKTYDGHNVAARKAPGSRFDKRRRLRENTCGQLSTVPTE